MSNLVKEYFPNAPDECQNCSGLQAAAKRLRNSFALAVIFASSEINPDNPAGSSEQFDESRRESACKLSRLATNMVVFYVPGIMSVARELYEQCENGPIVVIDEGSGDPLDESAVSEVCGSESPVGKFIPALRR